MIRKTKATAAKSALPTTPDPLQQAAPTNDAPPPIPRYVSPWNTTDAASQEPAVETPFNDESSAVDPVSDDAPTLPEPSDSASLPPPVVTRSGRRVRPNRFIYNDAHIHATTAYLETFSPNDPISEGANLLQPDLEAHEEPTRYWLKTCLPTQLLLPILIP